MKTKQATKQRKKPGPKPKAARIVGRKLVARDHVPEASLETVIAEFGQRIYQIAFDRAIDDVFNGMRDALKAKVR